MRRFALAIALALITLAALSAACGRYGSPHRVTRPAAAPVTAPVETVPLTDPAVSP